MVDFISASDCHLGYLEKDQVRGNDSLASFEEILQIAKGKNVGTCNFLSVIMFLFFRFLQD